MKRVLIWGTGSVAAMYYHWLIEKFEVLAFVNNESDLPKSLLGKPVINEAGISEYQYDMVVIAAIPENAKSIYLDAVDIGVCEDSLYLVTDLFDEDECRDSYIENTVQRQLGVLKDILSSTKEERSDDKWMYHKIIKYGINCFQRDWYKSDPSICWDAYGLMQIPEEFADFCVSLCTLKVDSAVEIGVYRGRSAYFMCALLAANNPDVKYTLVDIVDQLDNYDRFKEILPQLVRAVPSTSEDIKGDKYDFVFIDADHSYDGSIRDYENVGQYAAVMTVFHDIYAHEYDTENGGTVRMWREVMERTQGKEHRIYSRFPEKWMGIGCVLQ